MAKVKIQKSLKNNSEKTIQTVDKHLISLKDNSQSIFNSTFLNKILIFLKSSNSVPIIAILIFAGFFITYLITIPRFNIGYADSDELITVAYNLGIAHPPGYALYISMLHLFMKLPFAGSVAFHAHVFSALLQSMTLAIIFISIQKLLNSYKNSEDYSLLIAFLSNILTTILLGTSFLFWLYSIVAEKYSLLVFMAAIGIYFSVDLVLKKKLILLNLLYLGVIYGLMISYHPTSLILVPAVLGLYWQKKWYKNWRAMLYFLFGFGSSILLIIGLTLFLNFRDVNVSWNFTATMQGLWNNFTREIFMPIDNGQNQVEIYLSNFQLRKIFATIPSYFFNLIKHWGVFGLGFMILGFGYICKNNKFRFNLGLSALLAGIFLPLYLGFSENPGTQGVIMRQYLLGYLFLAIPLSLGIYLSLKQINKASTVIFNLRNQSIFYASLLIIGISLFFFRIQHTFKEVNLHDFDFVHDFYRKMLTDLPKNSMLGCFSDSSCFSLLYSQQVEGVRSDIIIVSTAYPLMAHYLDKIDNLHGFDYPKNPFRTIDYLTWNLDKRRVFVTDIPSQYFQLLGLNVNFLAYVPYGYYGEIVRKLPEQMPKPGDYTFSQKLINAPISVDDNMRIWNQMSIARLHMFNASSYIKVDDRIQAKKELDLMTDLLFKLPGVDERKINTIRVDIETKHPNENSKPGDEIQTVPEIMDVVNQFIKRKKFNKAYQGAVGALAIDPTNLDVRLTLADIYKGQEQLSWARLELNNVLKLDPNNASAAAKLQDL